MRIIDASKTAILELGYSGEKDRTRVKFYYGDVAEEFPGGMVLLQVKRPGENTKHDILLATDEYYNAWWTVTDYECQYKGVGECQLIYLAGDSIARKKIWRTSVDRSLEGIDASIPDTWQDIETRLLQAASDVQGTIQEYRELEGRAEEFAYQAEEIAYGTRDGVPVDSSNPRSEANAQAFAEEAVEARDEINRLIGQSGVFDLSGVYFVAGTQQSESSNWEGQLPNVDALRQGLTIAYYLPYRSVGFDVTLRLILRNGVMTSSYPVYFSGNVRMTTQYDAGSIIVLTFYNNTWRGSDYSYDSNTHLTMLAERIIEYSSDILAIMVQSDSNFVPLNPGHTLIRFPSNFTHLNLSSSTKYLNINLSGSLTPLILDGTSEVLNSDQLRIDKGSYLLYFDGANFVMNTDGTIPGQANATAYKPGLMSAADKSKLDGIAAGATNTVIDNEPTYGSTNAISSGAVYDELESLSDRISEINSLHVYICGNNEYDASTRVPTIAEPDESTIYLVPNVGANLGSNVYTEWIYRPRTGSLVAWERVGSADIDLSNYATLNDLDRVIQVADEEPDDAHNTLWIDEEADDEVMVATQDDLEELIIVDDEEPESTVNKLWIAESGTATYQLPTMADLSARVPDPTNAGSGKVLQTNSNGVPTWSDAPSSSDVTDVQIDGTSIVSSGVANVPIASQDGLGVVLVYGNGLEINSTTGRLSTKEVTSSEAKSGTHDRNVITPRRQHESVFYGLAKAAGDDTQSASSNMVGDYTNTAKAKIQSMLGVSQNLGIVCNGNMSGMAISTGQYVIWKGELYKASAPIAVGDTLSTSTNLTAVSNGGLNNVVSDVQVNSTSIVSNGVANVPIGSTGTGNVGVVSFRTNSFSVNSNGLVDITFASSSGIKSGSGGWNPINISKQHEATFYGLATASGDTTQSSSSNAVGTYTETAKSKISDMLNGQVEVSGTTPIITAMSGVSYICGEVSTLTIVAPATGCIDVVFSSGSTPTVLTVTSAKPNTTIQWTNLFDPTDLYSDMTYEINILNGEYGVVGMWTH